MEILLVLVALAFPVCAIWGFVLYQVVIALMSYRFNAELRINDFGRDLGVLAALPLGFGVGWAVEWIVRR